MDCELGNGESRRVTMEDAHRKCLRFDAMHLVPQIRCLLKSGSFPSMSASTHHFIPVEEKLRGHVEYCISASVTSAYSETA